MKNAPFTRRNFLQTLSAAGLTVMASRNVFTGNLHAESMAPVKKSIFICSVCGHIEFGAAPDSCPVCHAPKDNFQQNDKVFSDAEAKFGKATDKHLPVITAAKKSPLVTEKPSIAVSVKIGSTIHPMEESHHIRFIDFYIDDQYVSRLTLTLNNHPTAGIDIRTPGKSVRAVIKCNQHGYWQASAVPA